MGVIPGGGTTVWEQTSSLFIYGLHAFVCWLWTPQSTAVPRFPKDLVGDNHSLLLLHGIVYFAAIHHLFMWHLLSIMLFLSCGQEWEILWNIRLPCIWWQNTHSASSCPPDTVCNPSGHLIAGYWYETLWPAMRLMWFFSPFQYVGLCSANKEWHLSHCEMPPLIESGIRMVIWQRHRPCFCL